MTLTIKRAQAPDFDIIWEIIKSVISKGDTLAFSPTTTKEEMQEYWMAEDKTTYVSTVDNQVVGSYFIKDNQPGLGSHVANAAFVVDPAMSGKGIGKTMGIHSLEEARKLGYKAMQYNLVVSTNENAVRLWKSIGFSIIGQLPKVFNHSKLGLVDAYVMHRFL